MWQCWLGGYGFSTPAVIYSISIISIQCLGTQINIGAEKWVCHFFETRISIRFRNQSSQQNQAQIPHPRKSQIMVGLAYRYLAGCPIVTRPFSVKLGFSKGQHVRKGDQLRNALLPALPAQWRSWLGRSPNSRTDLQVPRTPIWRSTQKSQEWSRQLPSPVSSQTSGR